MNKIKALAICLAVLIAAVGGFLLLKLLIPSEKADESQTSDSSELIISRREESQIERVAYKNSEISYSVSRSGDGYIWDSDPSFPLDGEAATFFFEFASDIRYERLMSEITSKSEYSLDNPERVLTVYYSDGDSLTLNIGKYNPYVEQYYASVEGKDEIYLIGSTFTYYYDITLSDVIKHETVPIPSEEQDDVTEYKVTLKDGSGFTLTFVKGISNTDDSGNEDVVTKDRWDKTPIGGKPLEGDFSADAASLYTAVFGTEHTAWVAYNALGSLGKYGLSPSEATVTVTYDVWTVNEESGMSEKTTEELTVYIGSIVTEAPDSSSSDDPISDESEETVKRYYRIDGGEIIYTVDEGDFSAIFGKQ